MIEPVIKELAFLTEHTAQDEVTLFARALRLGLRQLYRETAEQAFIDGSIARKKAVAILGNERVTEIEYTKQALAQDIARGLDL